MTKSSFQIARSQRFIASPRARRALSQRNLDGKIISGSGPNGRVIEADVLQFQTPEIIPEAARSTPAASHLRAEVNATNLLKLSAKFENLSVTDLLLKIFACALPLELSGETEIGFAAKHGVISIRDAKRLTLFELAKTRSELGGSAAQSTPAHVLHNAGRGRIDEFDAPLSNNQKTALGAGAIASRPFVIDGNFEVCSTVKLTFAFDANALNAIEAAEIFERIIELVEEPDLLAFY